MKRKIMMLIAMVVCFSQMSMGKKNSSKSSGTTFNDSLSYALGLTTGINYMGSLQLPGGLGTNAINKGKLEDGFKAGLEGDSTSYKISKEQAMNLILQYMQEQDRKAKEAEEAAYKQQKPINDLFIENKSKEAGFSELVDAPKDGKHGTLLKVIEKGNGSTIADTDFVCMNYVGKLTNEKVFDKSENGTAVFPLDGIIRGLSDALILLKKGAKAEVIVPSELGYGRESVEDGDIPANSILIYDIEIINVFHTEEEAQLYLQSIGASEEGDEDGDE